MRLTTLSTTHGHYTMHAESSAGSTIAETAVAADSEVTARRIFWNGLTEAQRDATASVECLEVEYSPLDPVTQACHGCSGSGESNTDGARCSTCNGTGDEVVA